MVMIMIIIIMFEEIIIILTNMITAVNDMNHNNTYKGLNYFFLFTDFDQTM
jgi:hypothetical protein